MFSKSEVTDIYTKTQTIVNNNAILFYHKIKRFIIVHIKIRYVMKNLKLREGICNKCGKCCMIVYKCPFVKEKDGNFICLIYKLRPLQCRAFPINKYDLKDIGFKCSFQFKHNNDI